MIHIYYGFGQGKTCAAIGLGMRAKGAKKSVSLVQFLKDESSGELKTVPFEVFKAPENLPFNPKKEEYLPWVDSAVEYIEGCKSDVIILDEFLDVIPDFISENEAAGLIERPDKEIIITGHKNVKELFEKADYITYFEKTKHPYDRGVKARAGFEY